MYSGIKYSSLCFINSTLINTALLLLVILIGGILPLYERKFLSLTQRRVGPRFVGYKGRLQFIADALKVLWKEFVLLFNVNSFYFLLLPVLYLNINLLFFINIYWFSNTSLFNVEYNVVFFIIINILLHILIILVGFFIKNKYTVIASSRLINIAFSTELFVLLIDTFIYFLVKSFSFSKFFTIKNYSSLLYLSIVIIPLLLIFFLLETAKTPFDIVEAETEIIMGYHVEYSGFLFGLFVLAEYFHVFTSIYVLTLILC